MVTDFKLGNFSLTGPFLVTRTRSKMCPRCHGCLVHFVHNANYAFLCAMEIIVQDEILNDRITASCPTNILSKLLYKTLQTPKVNFEKLIG